LKLLESSHLSIAQHHARRPSKEITLTYRFEIIGLSCTRGDRPLFSDLDQQVNGGELLHVVGSNGSGKTTLIRALCGLSRPAQGDVRWNGESIRTLSDEFRQCLAYVGHQDGVQGELTPVENLNALSCLVSSNRTLAFSAEQRGADPALERMGLTSRRSLPSKVLSQGQKRRVALARLLVAQKPLWILDEPFTALDVKSCRLMNELLAEHLARGGVVVLSSHQGLEISGAAIKHINLDDARARIFDDVAEGATVRSRPAERDPA
jgi:heme exporter protein A